MQRVRVGMTGLASVVLIIGVASAVFSSANRETPVTAIGASNADVVANMTSDADLSGPSAGSESEPLAELGVAPSATADDALNAADIERALQVHAAATKAATPPR